MDLSDIKKEGNKGFFRAVFALEGIFPYKIRVVAEKTLRYSFFLIGMLLGVEWVFSYWGGYETLSGVFILVLVAWSIVFCSQCFYYSCYFNKVGKNGSVHIDFELCVVANKIDNKDITKGFFQTKFGKLFLARAGVSNNDFENFLNNRASVVSGDEIRCQNTLNQVAVKDFILAIFERDTELQKFMFTNSIQKKEAIGISEWISESMEHNRDIERWWSRESLLKVPSIGQDLAYGMTFNLDKYRRPLTSKLFGHYDIYSSYGVKEVKMLENILSRSKDANVIIVGDDLSANTDILSHLDKMIFEGDISASLNHKKVILFDYDRFVAINSKKSLFELEFINVMQEAISAGNVILAIADLPRFTQSTEGIGVDLPSLLSPFLESNKLQIVALATTELYHKVLEKNTIISQHFETILMANIDDSNTVKVIQNEIVDVENAGMFFTYPAVMAIVNTAERYFSSGVMPDKAVDLLMEIIPKLQSQGKNIVEDKDVYELIQTKTGIPVGNIGEKEKEILLNLEGVLHKRIVGQDDAIKAISNAVRRSRSGINSPDRPMGSFLFLGPTGVGKTETTKALAEVFFGPRASILRLDMSEYSTGDSVSKLIGSFTTGQAGVLSSMVSENPYGVLLLDEFEKTTKEVMNIFLSILDEGFFSDMAGKKINARNLIIIATSNAGSEKIREIMNSGESLDDNRDIIINKLISDGIFRPEFINRFDGVVLFHPLASQHLWRIAELMLGKLKLRLGEKGINLVIDNTLIDYVVTKGSDQKFGARPMNRVIQERIEDIISRKIIEGNAPRGSDIILTKEDLK